MIRALITAGVLFLALFVYLWPPAGALAAGLGCFWLAAERRTNQQKGAQR